MSSVISNNSLASCSFKGISCTNNLWYSSKKSVQWPEAEVNYKKYEIELCPPYLSGYVMFKDSQDQNFILFLPEEMSSAILQRSGEC